VNSALRVNFLVSLLGTFGSLYFSEVMKLPPCALCWYQRIFLYPLLFIFGVALWTEDSNYRKYAFPIALVGLVISIYHNLLYYGVVSEALAPCTQGVSCSSKQLELFGFITIPLLSMMSFLIVTALIAADSRRHERILNEK
jgi:disulfide bond formation protein DsbB